METTTTTTAVPPLELTRAPRKTPSLDLRDIPQAPGPEKGVLALMAMDPATYVGQCVTIGMTEDYFYLPAHKLLWRLFQARYNKNEPIDIVSITQALEDMHQLEAVGGSAGLAEIYTFTTTGAYFEHYLNVLKDKFILRSIIDIANQSTTQAFDNPDDVAELLDSVETHIFQIRERYNSAKDEQSLASILKQAVTNFEKFIASKGQIQGLTTGFEELDKKATGLNRGTCSSSPPVPPWVKPPSCSTSLSTSRLTKKSLLCSFPVKCPQSRLWNAFFSPVPESAAGKSSREATSPSLK